MLKLNVRNLLTGPPNRLRYTFRYSTCRIAHPESVAEHSYYVCLYSLAIADWVNYSRLDPKPGSTYSPLMVDKGLLLEKAVLHDLEECVSGDFPRTFKYSNEETKSVLDRMAEIAFDKVSESLFGTSSGYLSERTVKAEWNSAWTHGKDHTVEGRIVNVADFLCVLGFMNDEADAIRLQHVSVLEGYYRLFQKSEFDFLRQILDQAGELLKEISGGTSKASTLGGRGGNDEISEENGIGSHAISYGSAGDNGLGRWREGTPPSDPRGSGEAVRQPSPQHADAGLPNHGAD
jgi:5'-deoxynucleotidase YfbR-like HD superfamily hydrolase